MLPEKDTNKPIILEKLGFPSMLDSGIESINFRKTPNEPHPFTIKSESIVEPSPKKSELLIIGFDESKSLGPNPLASNPESQYTMNYESRLDKNEDFN